VAFRRQALALLDEGRTVRDVAASLGIAGSCLHRWRRQQRIDQGQVCGISGADRSELAAAKQRIRDLEEGVKILRKAAAAVEEVVPPKERFCLVGELAADGVRVRKVCQALGVSRPSSMTGAQGLPPRDRYITRS
jgi:putative transposase